MSTSNPNRLVVADFATAQSVSSPTVLMPFTDLGQFIQSALFCVVNQSSTDTLTMTLDTSQDGVSPDTDKQWAVTVGTSAQGSIEIGAPVIRRYWRLSASPTANPVNVQWQVTVQHKR